PPVYQGGAPEVRRMCPMKRDAARDAAFATAKDERARSLERVGAGELRREEDQEPAERDHGREVEDGGSGWDRGHPPERVTQLADAGAACRGPRTCPSGA